MPTIKLPDRLQYLVKYCEKQCVAECCGIDAYDFSPLHVASYLSAYSGAINEAELREWESELNMTSKLVDGLSPAADGTICSVAGMNQCFTREEFLAMIGEILHSIRVSPQMVEYSDKLREL